MSLHIRSYHSSDIEQIAKLFFDTVHTINAKDYTIEQLNVWATGNIILADWDKSFTDHYTLVAEKEQQVIRSSVALTNYVMEKTI